MKNQPTPFSLRSNQSGYSVNTKSPLEEKKIFKIMDRNLIRKITGRE